jgi:GNAT superfamily N-acetyltransferase
MPPEGITFRPQIESDGPFLAALYASTRAGEMAMVPWTDQQKWEFLEMQFRAQSMHYAAHYAGADFLVIERNSQAVGRIYIDRTAEEICLIDIALLPEQRGGGVGTALIRELLEEAEKGGQRVTIHVERFNPALNLYLRLGFQPVEETGVYYLMHWLPTQRVALS